MADVTIPKFSFGGNSIKTDEELNAKLAETSTSGGKYFRPGKHTVKIAAAVYQGQAGDDRWGKFLLTLNGVGEKTTTAQLIVPFKDVMYLAKSGKETIFMFKKIQNFMSGLGVNLTVGNLQDTLTTYFTNPGKSLVGKELVIDIGYAGNHVAYAGKNTVTGDAEYQIKMRDGSVVLNSSDLTPLLFSTRDAAMAHAESQQIKIEEYSSVLNYEVSPTAKLTAVAGW
jgi:hypothetical protein